MTPVPFPKGTGLGRKLALSWIAMALERLTVAAWPLVAVVVAFLTVSWAGLWEGLPGWLHSLGLAGFGAAAVWGLVRLVRGLRAPLPAGAALRRLEQEGGVAHRPLTTVLDRPAAMTADKAALALWLAHQRRMSARIAALRVAPPKPLMARIDRYGLRVFLMVLVVASAVIAGDRTGPRLAGAFAPHFAVAQEEDLFAITAWIAQPDYTGLPPIFLTEQADRAATAETSDEDSRAIAVAAGSRLFARVHHTRPESPVLAVGAETRPFETVDAVTAEIEHEITADEALAIRQGAREVARWPILLIPDAPPVIEPVLPFQQTARGTLRLEYSAEDDYGLETVRAIFARIDGRNEDPLTVDLPLSGRYPRQSSEASYHDLTPHPWAGLPVLARLEATDGIGQTTASEAVALTLPAREFNHPIAQAIVDLRRAFAAESSDRARTQVQSAMDGLSERTGDYGDDLVAYLSMRVIISRLGQALDADGRQSVIDLMWDVALRIEEGQVALAQENLREAQDALRDALNRDASAEELQALMDKLEDAMREYLDQLAQNPEDPPAGGEQNAEGEPQMQDRNELEDMLDQARDMAMTGAREAAQDMLEQLQELLENLRNPEAGNEMAGDERQPQMEQLEQLLQEQEELLEETFDNANNRQGEPDQAAAGDGEQNMSQRQEALRRALGELMRQIGESGHNIPQELGQAERAMRDARQELERSRPDRAIRPQAQALDRLREGARIIQNEMAEAQGNMAGQNNGQFNPQDRRDPLGRLPPGNSGDPNGQVDIPLESDLQRSRQILDELYRRSGERKRPEVERDYIERLLKWY